MSERLPEGEFRLWFDMPSTSQRYGVLIRHKTINEIFEQENGLAALLDIFRWPKLVSVFPAAHERLKMFFAVPRIQQLVALHKEDRKERAIQRNRRKAANDLFDREMQDRQTEYGGV